MGLLETSVRSSGSGASFQIQQVLLSALRVILLTRNYPVPVSLMTVSEQEQNTTEQNVLLSSFKEHNNV